MANRFEWDYKAAGDLLLKSEEIADACEEAAARMTRATGMGYKADVRMGKKRVRAMAKGNPNDSSIKKSRKFQRDPKTGWPICPKCGEAHYNCNCWKKKG